MFLNEVPVVSIFSSYIIDRCTLSFQQGDVGVSNEKFNTIFLNEMIMHFREILLMCFWDFSLRTLCWSVSSNIFAALSSSIMALVCLCLSACPSFHLSVRLSVHLSVCPVCQSACPDLFTTFLSSELHEAYTRHISHKVLVVCTF